MNRFTVLNDTSCGAHWRFTLFLEPNKNWPFPLCFGANVKMPIDFYYESWSPPCRNVILLANILGIELNPIKTTPSKGDTRRPEYIQVNINHTDYTCKQHYNDWTDVNNRLERFVRVLQSFEKRLIKILR